MVIGVRLLAPGLALLVLSASPAALAATRPSYVRASLDDDAAPPAARQARHIRSTLDDPSHAAFPLDAEGRLIRLTLDEGDQRYGRLAPANAQARRVRTTLD